ncbi:MAG: hypothetical protein P4M01_12370 [Acidobacteriota bacterium]|nr:hypothetical protein [Acidobacteriota bacterium]
MDADFSIELGPTAPALELPWSDPAARVRYLDLRREPARVDELPEAAQFPALRSFLLAVNSAASPWQSAKCDVWSEAAGAAENLYGAAHACGSYLDIVLAGVTPARDNLTLHEAIARRIANRLEEHEALPATAEIVVRRCYFHAESVTGVQDESTPGYCLTLFVTGWGDSLQEAAANWAKALECLAGCLLQPPTEVARAPGSELG